MMRVIWLICLCFSAKLEAAVVPVDLQFKAALAQLNRVNRHVLSNSTHAQTLIFVDDKLAEPVLKAVKKDASHTFTRDVLVMESYDFMALFNALKLSIELTHQIEPTPPTLLPINRFKALSLRPKALLDEALVLDRTALTNDDDLHQLCENLIVLGFFSRDRVTYQDDLAPTAWLCYALYEVRSQKRDLALLVMLAETLSYADAALEYAALLPSTHPLYEYYFDKIEIKSTKESSAIKSLQVTSPQKYTQPDKYEKDQLHNKTHQVDSGSSNIETEIISNQQSAKLKSDKTILLDDVFVENRLPKDESKNQYSRIKPDYPPLKALLTLRRALDDQSSEVWQAAAFSASRVASPTILFNGIETVPENALRTKLLMLSPLMLVNDFLGKKQMQKYWFNKTLRTSIEDISLLTQTLSASLDYPPMRLIDEFSKQIVAAPAPSGQFLLPSTLVKHYWQSRLFNAYVVLATYLKKENYHAEVLSSLANVIAENQESKVGELLHTWLSIFTSAAKPDNDVNQLNYLLNNTATPIELKVSTLLSMEKNYDTKVLLPDVNQVVHELDSSDAQQQQKWRLMAAFFPEKIKNTKRLRYWASVRLTPDLLQTVIDLNDDEVIKLILEGNSDQYLLPSHRARLFASLFRLKVKDGDWLIQLAKLYHDYPNHYVIAKTYLAVLIQLPDQTHQSVALKVLEDWVYAGRDLSRTQYLSLIAMLAEVKLNLGETDAAKRIINPTLKYRSVDNFRVAMKIAVQSGEIKVGQKLLTYFRRYFPEQVDMARAFDFELALLAGNVAHAAKTLTTLPKEHSPAEFDQYVAAYHRLVKAKKLSKTQQVEFLRQLKRHKLSERKINALRTDHIFT